MQEKVELRPLKAADRLPVLLNDYYQNMWESRQAGKLVAWSTNSNSFELLKAMDIVVGLPEVYGGLCAITDVEGELCLKAEALGYSPALCSVIRNMLGVSLSDPAPEPETLPWGGMPKPDLLLCSTYCPGVVHLWEEFSRIFNVPLLMLEKPRLHDIHGKEDIAHFVKHSIGELKEVIGFLEGFTGRRFDHDRLCEIMALERETSEVWQSTSEMCQNIPAPMNVMDATMQVNVYLILRGELAALTHLQELKAEISERVDQKIGTIVGEEKYRLYWENLPMMFNMEEIAQKLASYGCVPVLSIFNSLAAFPDKYGFAEFGEYDPGDPLKILAERWILNSGHWSVGRRIEYITKLMGDYSIDGILGQVSRTCQLFSVYAPTIMKALSERTGLPAMVFEGDMADPRQFSQSEFDSKLEAFAEILTQRSG